MTDELHTVPNPLELDDMKSTFIGELLNRIDRMTWEQFRTEWQLKQVERQWGELLQHWQDISDQLRDMYEFHQRAFKLMKNKKPFVVVAVDESYFGMVYRTIRDSEKAKGRWTDEDEQRFVELMKEAKSAGLDKGR